MLDVSTVPECINIQNDSSSLDDTNPTIKVLHYPEISNDLMDGTTKYLNLKQTLLSKNWLTDSFCSEMENDQPKKIHAH